MADNVTAVSGISIRLTEERWGHIVLQHPEVAPLRQVIMQAIAQPERVLETSTGERMAVMNYEPENMWLSSTWRIHLMDLS